MEVNVYCFLTKFAYLPVSECLYTLFIYMRNILLINSPNRVIFLILSTLQPKVCLPKNSPFGYFFANFAA